MKDLVIQLQAKVITLLEGTPKSVDELVTTSKTLQNETVAVLNRQYQRLASPYQELLYQQTVQNGRNGGIAGSGYASGYRDGVEYTQNYIKGVADGIADTLQGTQQGQINSTAKHRQLVEPQAVNDAGNGIIWTAGSAVFGVATYFPKLLYSAVLGPPPKPPRQARLDSSNRIHPIPYSPQPLLPQSKFEPARRLGAASRRNVPAAALSNTVNVTIDDSPWLDNVTQDGPLSVEDDANSYNSGYYENSLFDGQYSEDLDFDFWGPPFDRFWLVKKTAFLKKNS
jgi:hypothetical protein